MALTVTERRLVIALIVTAALLAGDVVLVLSASVRSDLSVGSSGSFSARLTPVAATSASVLRRAQVIIVDRADILQIPGTSVSVVGGDIEIHGSNGAEGRALLSELSELGELNFRQVLCQTFPLTGTSNSTAAPLPRCDGTYAMTRKNLDVTPDLNVPAGYVSSTMFRDPQFTRLPSTAPSVDRASHTVLLPVLDEAGLRFVLGRAQLTGTAVKSARAAHLKTGGWIVQYTFTQQGTSEWNRVAQHDFHTLVGVDLDGVVQTAPIVEPTDSVFQTFLAQGSMSGNFTKAQAETIALALDTGTLPVELTADDIVVNAGASDIDNLSIAGALLAAGLVVLAVARQRAKPKLTRKPQWSRR